MLFFESLGRFSVAMKKNKLKNYRIKIFEDHGINLKPHWYVA